VKRQTRFGTALLMVLGMIWMTLPAVHVMAVCFRDCGSPPPPPVPMLPAVVVVPAIDMDTNVSFNDSDVGVVLYKVEGDGSNIKMDVYGLKKGASVSSYLFSISQDDLAALPKPPTKNTLLAAMGDVSVYMLTTGEIQVNAGPDSEGKMHVKILDGIPWTTVYGYTVDSE